MTKIDKESMDIWKHFSLFVFLNSVFLRIPLLWFTAVNAAFACSRDEVQQKVKAVGRTNEVSCNSVSNSCSFTKVKEGTKKKTGLGFT